MDDSDDGISSDLEEDDDSVSSESNDDSDNERDSDSDSLYETDKEDGCRAAKKKKSKKFLRNQNKVLRNQNNGS